MLPSREELIKSLSQKRDPRKEKWENRIILDTLQEMGESSASDLVKAINTKHECTPELLTYSQVYGDIIVLKETDVLDFNSLTKKYSVNEEYVTVTEHIKYLPVSNYCVNLFIISMIGLVISTITETLIPETASIVIIGGLYLFCQLIGSEFDYEGRRETAVIANGVKGIHRKIVNMSQ